MRQARWRGVAVAVVAMVGGGLLSAAVAAAPPAKAAPPDGAAILDRYVEVTGGKAAYDSVRNRVMHATMELAAMNIKLDMTQYQARPRLQYVVVESQVAGKMESGVTGDCAWETSTMTGPRLLEGAEEQETMRDALFDLTENWRRTFPKAEVAGADTIAGRSCWKVVLTPRFGRARTQWFDQETGLLQQVEVVVESQAGAVTVKARPGDYRKVGTLLLPFRTEMEVLGQTRVIVVHSIEQNVELPADRFAPPAEVQKLIDAKQQKKQ